MNKHIYDLDGTCLICGFDGAEFSWWKKSTYEGLASPETKEPACKDLSEKEWDKVKQEQNLLEDEGYQEDDQYDYEELPDCDEDYE